MHAQFQRHALGAPRAQSLVVPPMSGDIGMADQRDDGIWRQLREALGDARNFQFFKRADIADRRAVPENKIKSQVNRLLSKTECASLAELATEAMYEFLFDTRRAPAKKPTLIRRPPGRPDE